jgi:predicted Zn-dependent protease
MEPNVREDLARRTLARSNAGRTEVLISYENAALTRFAHENVHQNVASEDAVISVRAILGGRTGVAQTNRTDDASIRDVVERATAMAKLAPSDPAQPDLPSGGPTHAPPGAFVEATAHASAETRAKICGEFFRVAERDDLWSAGYASTASHGYTVANDNGVMASFDGTAAGVNVKMSDADSTGFAEYSTSDVEKIDATAVAETSARKARETRAPKSIEPGPWTVILEPPAFAELLTYLSAHFSAQAYDEGSSFCSGGLGTTMLGENVTIRDDYAHPLALDAPFDFEGAPTKRLALVEDGVVRSVVTDSYWAHKLDMDNTGHALPAPNAYGPQPRNLVVMPGTKTTEELIASTKRGILVSRLWYVRTVDQRQAIVTGMTRDGTYMIEDGKLGGGVRNLRFNQSIVEALKHCELGLDLHRSSAHGYAVVVPSIKIENFAFSSTTEF